MAELIFDQTIKELLTERLKSIEEHFSSDALFYYGDMFFGMEKLFRDVIERLKSEEQKREILTIILNTSGGSVETVEKVVEIIRFHYKYVYFVVPDFAMSAGTVFCMAGDKIFMDYSSSLGPIDPQVYNGKEWVPASGYLDKVEELLNKAKDKTITEAEFLILQGQDLATLSRYEQQRNLTTTLLKKWLAEYKFKDWLIHESDPVKKGQLLTKKEKEQRAEEMGNKLSNNKYWHSHGRMISLKTLKDYIRLKVEDYSDDPKLQKIIRAYNDLIVGYINRHNMKVFLHSRTFF